MIFCIDRNVDGSTPKSLRCSRFVHDAKGSKTTNDRKFLALFASLFLPLPLKATDIHGCRFRN